MIRIIRKGYLAQRRRGRRNNLIPGSAAFLCELSVSARNILAMV